jgi:hypothetical protein
MKPWPSQGADRGRCRRARKGLLWGAPESPRLDETEASARLLPRFTPRPLSQLTFSMHQFLASRR